jgi:hypothetical protein
MAILIFGIQIRRRNRVDRYEFAVRRESRPLSTAKCLPDPSTVDVESIETTPESRRFAAS